MKLNLLIMTLIPGSRRFERKDPVKTVPRVDLQRYLGKWYQIAYFPTRFQPNKGGMVTAE
jgi:apolipoprotein D and lipocalin family protein